MSKLRLTITMSLDGYVAGPNQSEENPPASAGWSCTTESLPEGERKWEGGRASRSRPSVPPVAPARPAAAADLAPSRLVLPVKRSLVSRQGPP